MNTNKYLNYAGIREEYAFHNGVDVALFSNGFVIKKYDWIYSISLNSNLFLSGSWGKLVRGVRDQSFIGNIIAYTSCIGPYTNEQHCNQQYSNNSNNSSKSHITRFWYIYIPIAAIAFVILGFYFFKRNEIVW